MSESNYRILLAYDGTDFCGWQIQASSRTVQGEVERALELLHEKAIRVRVAGRTDSGVHARGQVISFRCETTIPCSSYIHALNSRLPRDVRAVACTVVSDEFHARYSAKFREYKYYLEPADISDPFSRRYALTVKTCPSLPRLNAAAAETVGRHDFTTFSAIGDQSESRVRFIRSASFYREGRFVVFRIVGNAFLWKMVRSLVGTMLEVASAPDPGRELRLRLAARDRNAAGATAPAKGLFLTKVYYDE